MSFISQALASTNPAAPVSTGSGFDPIQLLPMVLIFGVMYFLLIRPQQKKAKEHQETISALRKGDRIVTGGGIIGVVQKLDNDTEITVEIAEGVNVHVLRATIGNVLTKPEPANATTKASSKISAKKA